MCEKFESIELMRTAGNVARTKSGPLGRRILAWNLRLCGESGYSL